jgi:hypothetical protein
MHFHPHRWVAGPCELGRKSRATHFFRSFGLATDHVGGRRRLLAKNRKISRFSSSVTCLRQLRIVERRIRELERLSHAPKTRKSVGCACQSPSVSLGHSRGPLLMCKGPNRAAGNCQFCKSAFDRLGGPLNVRSWRFQHRSCPPSQRA